MGNQPNGYPLRCFAANRRGTPADQTGRRRADNTTAAWGDAMLEAMV